METLCRRALRYRYSVARALLTCITLLEPDAIIAAGPSVAELLLVCESGFAQGNRGLDAAACEWYAAPCACGKRGADLDMPGWCVPASEAIDDTVRKVISELRRHPDPAADVELVVPEILTRIYPCQTTSVPPLDLASRVKYAALQNSSSHLL